MKQMLVVGGRLIMKVSKERELEHHTKSVTDIRQIKLLVQG